MMRRLRAWLYGSDDGIDALIARNAARSRPQMHAVDWRKVERAGQVRWQAALRGQRKLAQEGRPGRRS